MTQQDTAQIAALCQELAEWEVGCPACETRVVGAPTCQTCRDSRKVPLFPGVRVPCPFDHPKHDKLCLCHGNGWVPSTDMEAWMAVALSMAIYVEFSDDRCRLVVKGGPPHWFDAQGITPFLALLRALRAGSTHD